MKFVPTVLASITVRTLSAPLTAQNTAPRKDPMDITLTIGGQTLKATLTDSETARDFLSLLPLSLKLEDYASTEKIAYPPRKLSARGAPAGSMPKAGDLA